MTLRFYDGGSFKILAAKPLVHWLFLLACLVFRALLMLPFAVDMDSYLVLAATNLTSTSMTMTTWVPTTGPPSQCPVENRDPCTVENSKDQYITSDTVEHLCNQTGRTHIDSPPWKSYYLGFCKWRTYESLLGKGDENCFLYENSEECSVCLHETLQKEIELEEKYKLYENIILRFDCKKSYSMWTCQECKEAYKDWLCATRLDYYDEDRTRVKPCRSHCLRMGQRCPYLLPYRPYCGQRAFLCPEERDALAQRNSTYASSKEKCFDCDRDDDGPCIAEDIISPKSHGVASIHSIPRFTVLLLGCVVSLILARTLHGQSLT